MARRVFEIAKELGVASKAIVQKCHAEGIPSETIKNHMSSVSAGLEATIREWFAEASDATTTAVETSEKVDLKTVRAKPRAKAKARSASDAAETPGEATTATATVEAPAPPTEPSTAQSAPGDEPGGDAGTPSGPAEPPQKASPTKAPAPLPGVHVAPAPAADETPASPDTTEGTPSEARPAAAAPDSTNEGGTEGADGSGEAASPPPSADGAPGLRQPIRPAPMNVPTRPTSVAPAGPRLEQKQQIRLSGPKVVRVEAPEVIDSPRPRRGPPAGGGYDGMPPPSGDDSNSGRNSRRSGPGGGGPGGGGDRKRGDRGGDRRGGGRSFRQQDIIEREARLQRSGGFLKKRRQQARRGGDAPDRPATLAQTGGKVKVTPPLTIKDLSAATGVKAADIVKALFMEGVMATINSGIDTEKAQEILMEYEIELEIEAKASAEEVVMESFADRVAVDGRPRGPVVTILGHVDHGKTSLLDRIRNANVAEGEAGGITQATSAFRVPVKLNESEKFVVFIDTPGHEAFTAMRARGASTTDIVVLVVAADDGVMPQTAESISHAKAAGVPIVVALNKIDKPEATDSNIQKILGQLAEHGLNPTEWGGDTEVVRTSAIKGEGIDDLLEILDLQAEILELTADFGGAARGSVIESRHEQGRGAVANVIIQDGLLKRGGFIVAGRAFGRVRDITDDRGKRLDEAVPPMPVQISGLDELPAAGDKFYCVDTLKKAQEAAEQRRERDRDEALAQPKVTLDTMFSRMDEADVKEILIVLKADVQGSIDVLKNEVEKVSTDEVKVRVLHAAVGGITESDVVLAGASSAIIIGFNVIPASKARSAAEGKGVEIRTYDVIYHITEDITKAAEGLLEPELRQEVLGHAEVRQVFRVSKAGMVAGCYVTDGTVERDALIRVTRNDIVIENDRRLEQLKRFKDDAKDVRSGMECGMKIVGYDDIKQGDILECYRQIEVARKLR